MVHETPTIEKIFQNTKPPEKKHSTKSLSTKCIFS